MQDPIGPMSGFIMASTLPNERGLAVQVVLIQKIMDKTARRTLDDIVTNDNLSLKQMMGRLARDVYHDVSNIYEQINRVLTFRETPV